MWDINLWRLAWFMLLMVKFAHWKGMLLFITISIPWILGKSTWNERFMWSWWIYGHVSTVHAYRKGVQCQVYIQQRKLEIKINKFSIPSYRIMDNSTEERLLLLEEFDREGLKKRVWNESKKLWRIAFPGIIARVTSFGMIVVTQLFMGHISDLDLAAFGLQQSILLRFVNGILVRILLTYCD